MFGIPNKSESILGDPGEFSGGGEKSEQQVKNSGEEKSRINFFLAHSDFSPPPLTAPGSPRME